MYRALRKALFALEPERAHAVATAALLPLHRTASLQKALAPRPDPRLQVQVLGNTFPNPLGVAAGFDKEAHLYNALFALGFGHVELGTVTPRAQPGNPRPRIDRLPDHLALVNRMGFPGPGALAVQKRLEADPPRGKLGINIGPNKQTPAAAVAEDLAEAATALARHATYLAINVSSPNTPGLRALQEPRAVAGLVQATMEAADDAGATRPVLLKLHPDAADEELVRVARAAVDAGAAGLVATNTTRARPPGTQSAEGGLSGAPLRPRSVAAVSALHDALPDVPVIGVGGIATAAHALEHLDAGATLVQAYTGFVYEGPAMARRIAAGILDEVAARGAADVTALTAGGRPA